MTTSAATPREPARSGAEQDVISAYRNAVSWRPGEVSEIKRRIRRRERRNAAAAIRDSQEG